jgi:hypothetical protein
VNGEHLHGKMRGVLYVPGLGINLYSIGSGTDIGLKVVFDDDTVSFSQDDVVIMEGKREGKKTLYQLNIQAKENHHTVERALSAAQVASLSLWHQRFGHLNHKTVLRMATLGSVAGLALFNDKLHLSTHCRGCLLGKISRTSFRVISSIRKVTPFELWHGKEPDVSHLRTFGSPAFTHIPDEKRRKLDPKATEGIMVGYGDSSKVYKIWDPVTRKIMLQHLNIEHRLISKKKNLWQTKHHSECCPLITARASLEDFRRRRT